MNYKEIFELAKKYKKEKFQNYSLSILEKETIEEKDFFVFFFGSNKKVKEKELDDIFFINAPIIVSKTDGKIYETGNDRPIEYYINNFKEHGDPYKLSKKSALYDKKINEKNKQSDLYTQEEMNNLLFNRNK